MVQTKSLTVRASLDGGGTGELLGRRFGVCTPTVDGNHHAAGVQELSISSGEIICFLAPISEERVFPKQVYCGVCVCVMCYTWGAAELG